MKPATRNLKFIQGATFNEVYRLFIDTARTTRYDLTGFGVRMQIRDKPDATGNLIWDSTDPDGDSSLSVTAASDGEITLIFPADVVAGLQPGFWWYDLEVFLESDPTGTVFRLFQGRVQLLNDNVTI